MKKDLKTGLIIGGVAISIVIAVVLIIVVVNQGKNKIALNTKSQEQQQNENQIVQMGQKEIIGQPQTSIPEPVQVQAEVQAVPVSYRINQVKPLFVQGQPSSKAGTWQQLLGGYQITDNGPIKKFSAQCGNAEKGAYIDQFLVNSGDLIDAVGFRCSDGTMIAPQGGLGGKVNPPITSYQDKGFDGMVIRSGDYLDSITIQEVDRENGLQHQLGGLGGNNVQVLQCPTGQRLTGLSGNYDKYINYLEATCIDIDPR